jgi:Ca-activated chloride channel homolog
MGRHSAEAPEPRVPQMDPVRRRRRWPVAAFVAVLVIVGGWYGWSWLHGPAVAQVDATTTADCPAGPETIQVAVAPSIADAVTRAAAAFAASHPVVTDHCVRVSVSSVDQQAALDGLEHNWDTKTLGPKPAAWLPDSSLWTNQLAADDPKDIGASAQSVASSPIVLAMPTDAANAMSSVGVLPSFAALPGLSSKSNGWATYDEPGWGKFTIALPGPNTSSSTALALEAMLDPATPLGQSPVTAGLLESHAVHQNLDNLTAAQPTPALADTHAALIALGGAKGIQHAPFTAVPVSELQLYERNVGSDDGTVPPNMLDEVRLKGPTPSLDFPFLPLGNYWVDTNAVAGAEQFEQFLISKTQQAQLGMAGLRGANMILHPTPSPGMDWGNVAESSTPTDAAGFRRLVTAWQTATH